MNYFYMTERFICRETQPTIQLPAARQFNGDSDLRDIIMKWVFRALGINFFLKKPTEAQ